MTTPSSSSTRCTYRLFNAAGEKLATAVNYKDTIFQVAPEKKSFPTLEAWKAEHPSNTSFTEDQKVVKAPQPPVWRPYRKAITLSLRHLTEYYFQYQNQNIYYFHPKEQELVEIKYKPWFDKAFCYKINPDNSGECVEFTSFKELGLPTETPDLWVQSYYGIRQIKLPMYDPAPGQKEAFVLLAGRNTAVLAAQELKKKLEEKGVLVHYGFYYWNIPFRDQIWMGSPYVFKVEQTLVTKIENFVYEPMFTHMRTKPWAKDLLLNVHPKPEDHQQKGIDACLEIVCGK
jgi:hypothetical protein